MSTTETTRHLTARQQDIYDFLCEFHLAHGYSPTIRDICHAAKIGNTNGVVCHLKVLVKKGYLKRIKDVRGTNGPRNKRGSIYVPAQAEVRADVREGQVTLRTTGPLPMMTREEYAVWLKQEVERISGY